MPKKRQYRPYLAYRHSGVEWIGEVPEHWEVRRLKYVSPLRVSRLDRKPSDQTYIGLENIESWTGRLLLQAQAEQVEGSVNRFEAGDVLFGKLRPYLAKVARPAFKGVCTGEAVVLQPGGCSQSYLFYLLLNDSYIRWIDAVTYGTKMPRVSPDQIANGSAPFPPLDEQQAIAAFLDRETAKIDALVEKKERLIKLLQEKRAALVTQAVTKGLEPEVAMKDSGVEWPAKVPRHWELYRAKRLSSFVTSGSRGWATYYTDEGPLFLRIGNLRSGCIDLDLEDVQRVSPPKGAEGERTRVQAGDILISITALIGAVAVVNDNICEAYVNQHLALLRPTANRIESRWLAHSLASIVGQSQFQEALYGGTKDGLGLEDIRTLFVLARAPF